MPLITLKGREKGIELCFSKQMNLNETENELTTIIEKNSEFFNGADEVFYSGTFFDFFEEVKFCELLKSFFGKHINFHKQQRLTTKEIKYSLNENEAICKNVYRSLRSGETVKSRGDIVIYGDVNPGAVVSSNGNITVIGALRGIAQTRKNGKIYATLMNPTQLRIGNVYSYCKKNKNVGPSIATEENGEIILRTL